MSIVEIYDPKFDSFHETPIIMWQEPKRSIQTATNMLIQYEQWLSHWTDPFRDKWAPAPAFWESGGPHICRALQYCRAVALVFEYVADQKVHYRWFAKTPEGPIAYKRDHYSICDVHAEVTRSGEGRVTVTLPTDEDVSFYWHASTMKSWLKQKPVEEKP